MDLFDRYLVSNLNKLLSFKKSTCKNFDIHCFEKIDPPEDLNLKEIEKRLNPQSYGRVEDYEYPPLEWLSVIITAYQLGYKLNTLQIIKALKAITYHGFYGLFELFGEIKLDEHPLLDQFYLSKEIAKYYKGQGNYEASQKLYNDVLRTASKIGMLPYAFSLQSKLYSDYLQREGMCLAYSKIAYKRILKDKKIISDFPRWLQISIDTYAKEIYKIDPQVGHKIYRNLLKNNKIHPQNKLRIKFRNIELEFYNNIKSIKYSLISENLKEYEALINSIENNPKALYIRNIHLVGMYRKVILSVDNSSDLDKWLQIRIDSLINEEAEFILNRSISDAKTYNDRKFIALALYEKSYWINDIKSAGGSINDAINYLKNGLEVLEIDKKSIINKIYFNILSRIAKLYVQIKDWYNALSYYQKLYGYLAFLTQQLEKDKKALEIFLVERITKKASEFPEYIYLTLNELKEVKISFIIDYDTLTKKLLDYSSNINLIQNQLIISLEARIHSQKVIISHDLKKSIYGFRHCLDEIKNASYVTNENKSSIFEKAEHEVNKANLKIQDYEELTLSEFFSPNTIELNKEISDFIDLLNKNNTSRTTIKFIRQKPVYSKIPKFTITRLLENLVDNSFQVAFLHNQISVLIEIGLNVDSNIVKLIYKDNCKDIAFFKRVIDRLNRGLELPSKKNANAVGKGLTNIKKLLSNYNNNPWILSRNKNMKILQVPLFNIQND